MQKVAKECFDLFHIKDTTTLEDIEKYALEFEYLPGSREGLTSEEVERLAREVWDDISQWQRTSQPKRIIEVSKHDTLIASQNKRIQELTEKLEAAQTAQTTQATGKAEVASEAKLKVKATAKTKENQAA